MPEAPFNINTVVKKYAVTEDTIKLIKEYVNNYSYQVKDLAQKLKGANDFETGRNIWQWVKDNIEFVRDDKNLDVEIIRKLKENSQDIDAVRTAARTIADKKGDCDCMTTLVCSLLKENNIESYAKVVAYYETVNFFGLQKKVCGGYSHIYSFFYYKDKPVFIDTVPEITQYNTQYTPENICKSKKINMQLIGLMGVEDTDYAKHIVQETILGQITILEGATHGVKAISEDDLRKKLLILALDRFGKDLQNDLQNGTNFYQNNKEAIMLIEQIKTAKNEQTFLDLLSSANYYPEFFQEIKQNFEIKSENLQPRTFSFAKVDNEAQRYSQHQNFNFDGFLSGGKKNDTSQPSAVKKTLLTPVRAAFLTLVRLNFGNMAKKLALNYANTETAQKLGLSANQHTTLKSSSQKFIEKFKSFGGSEDDLKKSLNKNKKAAAIIKNQPILNGFDDDDDDESSLGFEPVSTAAAVTAMVATASPLIAAFNGLLGNVKLAKENTNLMKAQQKTSAQKETFVQKAVDFFDKLISKKKVNTAADNTNSNQLPTPEPITPLKSTNTTNSNTYIWIGAGVVLLIVILIFVFANKPINGVQRKRTTKKKSVAKRKPTINKKRRSTALNGISKSHKRKINTTKRKAVSKRKPVEHKKANTIKTTKKVSRNKKHRAIAAHK